MHYFITHHSTSDKLVLVQTLMQTAMKGLEREFYHMLKINGEYLDHESVSVSSSRASRASFSDLEDYESFLLSCSPQRPYSSTTTQLITQQVK
ncbi:hypothetical protein WN944_011739 [Citrus x changshan-huyou]|uniref:Uncharacterized protein n=1 Tax=Citrus x changshan-huyou TaxID=2935761 RepID=A0AAP0N0I0_9ROSI